MAQLKDTTVSGNIRVSNEVIATSVQATKIKVPTTSGGTTCGVGSDGQVLKSNGTSTYWGTDNNTTYTFANGTNGFTVTPSGGSAIPVTVTPSITNNVTGTGTSGNLAKFNGANSITDGPGIDASPTSGSTNVITSGGAYTALSDKMDKTNPTGTGSFSLNRKASTTVGTKSFAEGDDTTASGNYSHAEGRTTTASGSSSHAEGDATTASNIGAHAEGYLTTASNTSAHAEGRETTASGYASHSEGFFTTASGYNAHAEGIYTIANHASQHVFGEYNVADTNVSDAAVRGDYVEIVGNGTADNARSNARTLDWNGNEVLAGSVTATGGFVGDLTGNASSATNASTVNNLTVQTAVPSGAVFTDTKNTAGSTDTSSKIYLIGATSQAANPQTYSDDEVYTTSGVLTTKSVQVGVGAATMQYNTTTQSIDFIFT